jgi:outer membrane protein OmpA-like peptidoglycan-associated protein
MKCNPLRWLWGLLPLALIALLVNWFERPRIETDLRTRTQETLARAGLGWAATNFENAGRDGIISGTAVEETVRDRVFDVVSTVWGVRTIDNKAKLIDKIDRYSWSAARLDNNKLRIEGFVPSDTDRRTVLGYAKAAFPNYDVEDKMRLARGVPPKDAWLGGIEFGLKQLAKLKRSSTELDNLAFSISGEAESPAAYKQVRTAVAGLPKSLTLKRERITAPVISPFVWEGRYDGGQVVLSGFAPSDKARDQVVAHAKKAFPGKSVSDRMEIASGAPGDWERVADLALDQLAELESGTVKLSNVDLAVAGVATQEQTKDKVARVVRSGLPAAFRGTEAVTFKIAAIPTVSPYVTTSAIDSGAVVLTGHVPSEDARRELVGYARSQLPRLRVEDKLAVAAGQPDVWLACSQAGLRSLQRLGNGRFELRDRRYALTGETMDEGLHRSLPGDMRQGAPTGCEGESRIVLLDDPRKAEEARRAEQERRRAEEERSRRAEEERRRAAAAPTPPPPAPVVSVDACQKTLNEIAGGGNIQFERARADLRQESYDTLDKLAAAANKCPKLRIEIGGHTDGNGSASFNQRLSEQRATAVTSYLARRGVDEARLIAIGYGPSRPIADNATDEGRARNRRIEFVVREN